MEKPSQTGFQFLLQVTLQALEKLGSITKIMKVKKWIKN